MTIHDNASAAYMTIERRGDRWGGELNTWGTSWRDVKRTWGNATAADAVADLADQLARTIDRNAARNAAGARLIERARELAAC